MFFSKEMEQRLEIVSQTNAELKSERDKLREKLKQSEETLSHQVKVSKNLESVLERLQNGKWKSLHFTTRMTWMNEKSLVFIKKKILEKEAQNSIEFAKFQKTIKDQAKQIKSFETEVKTYQVWAQFIRLVLFISLD